MSTDQIQNMLIESGLLTAVQARKLAQRRKTDNRPIAVLAAEMFGVDEQAVWRACAVRFLNGCARVNLTQEPSDPACLRMLTPEQAWDSLVLPLRVEKGELICATTEETLGDAIALVQRVVMMPVVFVLANIRPLEQFIAERYAYEGVPMLD